MMRAILLLALMLVLAVPVVVLAGGDGDRCITPAGGDHDHECPTPTPKPTPTPTPTPTPVPTPTPTPVPPPTKTVRVSVGARGMLCGDPRAWTRFQNRGTVAAKVRISYLPGNKSKPAVRQQIVRWVPVGRVRIVGPTWVRGYYVTQVKANGKWHKLFSYRVGKTIKSRPWGTRGCPADRFGKPKWGQPMVSGAYARTFTIAR